MQNITKTTKTILFASLIAALILPFSAMEFAQAAPNENANDEAKDKVKHDNSVKKLKDTKKSYEKQLAIETDDKKKEKLRQNIKRGDLFVEVENILFEGQNEKNSKRLGEIYNELLNSYSPEDIGSSSEIPQTLTDFENSWIPPAYASSSGTFETSVQYRNDCTQTYGSSNGSWTAYDLWPVDYTYFSNTWQYPSTVKDNTANCATYAFEDNYLMVFGWETICPITTTSSSDSYGCYGPGPGTFVTIWSNSNYWSPVPNTQTHFTDIAGVTTKWL